MIKRFRDLSIKHKVMMVGVLPSLLALFVTCAAFIAVELWTARGAAEKDLGSLAEIIGNNSAAALTFDDPAMARETLKSLSGNPHIVAARIFDADGNPFAEYLSPIARGDELPERPGDIERASSVDDRVGVFREIALGGNADSEFGDMEDGDQGVGDSEDGDESDEEDSEADAESVGMVEKLAGNSPARGTVFLSSTLDAVNERLNRYVLVCAIAFVLASIASFLVARVLQSSISSPLQQAAHWMREIARGDGDLTHRLEIASRDEVGQLAVSFNTFVDKIRGIVASVGDTTSSLAQSSERIRTASKRLDADAQQAYGEISGLNENIQDISRNTFEAAQVASQAVEVTSRANSLVAKLGDSSVEIGNIVQLINSVAEQTNLLALNAAIEAANAGEAGIGFAVVANEVKELARQAGSATDDIHRKIEGVQGDTQDTVLSIGTVTEIIQRISAIQDSISNRIGTADSATDDNVIVGNLTRVQASAEATSANATATKSAADEVTAVAEKLQGLVGQFKY
ncbi:MAG: methyl-accepting chemotaxis protein [Planctomycetota bacterium]